MTDYLLQHGTRQTPQSEAMRSDQVLNEAGGYVWAVDSWTRLRRFLILGSEGGSYYATEKKMTTENVKAVRECIAEDGPRTVEEIVNISDTGRAPKNDPALYALAACISLGDKATKRAAAEALPQVARIGTHLYHFVAFAETMRGWGRTMRWAVSNWYSKNPEQLAFQAVKYRQRDGWSHRDLLRLAHPTASTEDHAGLFRWIVKGSEATPLGMGYEQILNGFERAQRSLSPETTADLIREYNLPREALLTEHLTSSKVWEALLYEGGKNGMPITALIRNLATMTRIGLLAPGADATKKVLSMLSSQELLTHARVHPMQLLIACRTYAAGRGLRGQNTWNPVASVVDALDEAFYLAFGNVKPTGKNVLIGIDSSGSMHGGYVNGVPGLTPGEAACAMALVFVATDPDTEVVLFDTGYMSFPLTSKMRLDTIYGQWSQHCGGGTDCSLPMRYALDHNRDVDAFLTLTDAQTWYGNSHPAQVLNQYRGRWAARYVEVQMLANSFSTGDADDAGTLRVIGFDTATPELISGFISGDF